MTLGEKIRTLRLENGMSMEELAHLLGVQRSAVNKYEKGIVVNLKRSTIAALARIFSVSPSYFLDDDFPIEITDDERQLISLFRSATDEGRDAALTILRKSAELNAEKQLKEKGTSFESTATDHTA